MRTALTLLVACIITAPVSAQRKPDKLDESIQRGVAFLHKMQEPDGAWTMNNQKNPAATGLAIMAFLSAGHVPGEGPYGASIEKGVRHLLREQQPNGMFGVQTGHDMYALGICTLALAEVAGMTDGALASEIKTKLELAVKLILRAQRTQAAGTQAGGWRYMVDGPDADMSVTGWQLLALKAAKNLGCDVPAERIALAVEYVKRSRDPSTNGFAYTIGGGMTVACTGTGILCLELCSNERGPTRMAVQAGSVILKSPPRWGGEAHFSYSLYYCSQAMFQLGNNYWSFFRPQLHKLLFDNQQTNGSWMPPEGYGPVYSTAMAVLSLTVEYRYLPIYQRGEDYGEERK